MTAAIEVEGVRFGYGGGAGSFRLRVDELRVRRGERIACVGPSGSGKTTLINLITGILTPDEGRVALDGTSVTGLGDAQRRRLRISRVGMVFQEFELLEYLSAGDNILLPYHISSGLRLTAEVRERAARLASATGISHTLRRRPSGLSQGERQRVAICRALVTEPGVVMCDEPTGNLDPETSGAILDLLFDEARARDATLFMVTHNHGILGRFDRVIDVTRLIGGAS